MELMMEKSKAFHSVDWKVLDWAVEMDSVKVEKLVIRMDMTLVDLTEQL